MKDRIKKFLDDHDGQIELISRAAGLLYLGASIGIYYAANKKADGYMPIGATYYTDDSTDDPHDPFVLVHMRNGLDKAFGPGPMRPE